MSRDPEAEAIISKVWANNGVAPRSLSHEEIIQQLYIPVINEGFKCLEEGIAIRPSDVDICCVYGYNWPRSTGGPMHYAGTIGLSKVVEILASQKSKPAALLEECVSKGWTLDSKELE